MIKQLSILFFCFSLGGCISSVKTTFPIPANKKIAYQAHLKSLVAQRNWQAQGLVGVRVNQKAQSANFVWTQKSSQFDIELYGPLGLGATYLQGRPGQVRLTTHDQKVYQAEDAGELMNQVLGWSVPVEGLVYWGRGMPEPGQPEQHTLNQYGFLATLEQNGWRIEYKRYRQAGALALPYQLVLTRPGIRVVAVFDNWRENF